MSCRFANIGGVCYKPSISCGFDTIGSLSVCSDDGLRGTRHESYYNDMTAGKECWGHDKACSFYEEGVPVFLCGFCKKKMHGFLDECSCGTKYSWNPRLKKQ